MDQRELGRKVAAVAEQTEQVLADLLQPRKQRFESMRPPLLLEAIRHSVLGGGKRFRPFLVNETARLFRNDSQTETQETGTALSIGPLRAGAAIELIHCYSLVHDDLPAMDDDDMRRGKPTLHKAYDEATAILAGDAMLTMAFDVLADHQTAKSAVVRARLVQIVAQSAGIGGMVGGQMLDLAAEGRFRGKMGAPSGESGILRIQSMKTGALIVAACRMGCAIGLASKTAIQSVDAYARALGLAFQIKDDLLDVEGSATALGKATGKDAVAGKATFVSLKGLEGAYAMLDTVTADAHAALARFDGRADGLRALLMFNRERVS